MIRMENVDSKEGARLILAYERVAELLSSSGDSGVQREHLLMGLVLHCTKNEETLLQNVLNTRDDLVLFYQKFLLLVRFFLEKLFFLHIHQDEVHFLVLKLNL